MFCNKCGSSLNEETIYCPKCGNKIIALEESKVKSNHKLNKKIIYLISAIIVTIIIGIFIINKVSTYIYNKNVHYTFKINGENFKIGEKMSYYEKKGYTYKDSFYNDLDYIVADGFSSHNLYYNNQSVMYTALHCKEKTNCSYSDSSVIKINFYNDLENVELANFIKIGTEYNSIVEILGEPDGKFYMNDNEYVWSFYDKGKIDNPYYILSFDSDKKVSNMKIGMWWYDGEYEYTVKK